MTSPIAILVVKDVADTDLVDSVVMDMVLVMVTEEDMVAMEVMEVSMVTVVVTDLDTVDGEVMVDGATILHSVEVFTMVVVMEVVIMIIQLMFLLTLHPYMSDQTLHQFT